MLAQAFISSRLDYCNSTLYGITDSLFRRLQAVHNATARLIWRAAQGPHRSDPAAASLAPGPRTSHLQARLVGFQGVARSVEFQYGGRLYFETESSYISAAN